MKTWSVFACTWDPCPKARVYRPVGTLLAESLGEALDQLYVKFEHVLQEDESLCVHWEPGVPSLWQRIAQEDPA